MDADDLAHLIAYLDDQAQQFVAQVETLAWQRRQHASGSADYMVLTGELDRTLVDLEDVRSDLHQARRHRWRMLQ